MSSSTHKIVVNLNENGLRLDKFLSSHLPDLSRTRVQALIDDGYVQFNKKTLLSPSLKVKEGEEITITIPPVIDAIPLPQDIPLDIYYEDDDVIVINKPAGLVVHPAPGNPEGTLVNALLNHCGDSLSGINGVKRPGIVHRLDKETSGLLVAAKNDKAHHGLAHQLATREMGRVYLAVVWGKLFPQAGTIEGAIGRDPHNRKRMAIRSNGRFARTHYKVLKYYGNIASLVECKLETGRTHQIRVHLTSKKHPLVGDTVYGKVPKGIPKLLQSFLEESWLQGRQALHAKSLSFTHPINQEKLEFNSDLPEDMRNLLNVLDLLD